MTRTQVNRIVRALLLLAVFGSFGLTLLAARPPARYFGLYPAVVGTRAEINADGGVPAAFVTLTDPAVIEFPESWSVPEQLCMVIRLDRGDAATAMEFDDYQPQINWDVPAAETLIINNSFIEAHTSDGAAMSLTNDLLKPMVNSKMPYLINWIGQSIIPLYKDRQLGGLACMTFTIEAKSKISPFLFLTFNIRNTHIERHPAFYFRYNDPSPPNTQPPQTFTLERRSIADYLAELLKTAPFVVRPAPR